ncbi:acyltransferase [Abyssicoccus albus]|uniref:Succinyltransferase-like protein n=1 Tax=Abyssicoccus albus TaxID=1817405 RepID=A0A3N5BIP4_9BACL|nr:acyltransferase [Abyssicoccus albus]RPF57487.1 succinyltransferase-like protein [Abyssicoccus albus]
MRKLKKVSGFNVNPLWNVYQTIRFTKVLKNTLVMEICRFIPSMKVKRKVYQQILKMNIGSETSIAYKVVFDLFYPEKIFIGNNCVIGYNTTLLTHEYLTDEYRLGEIHIGDHVMIGANCTILPGVTIGHHATIGAGSVVTKDIPAHTIAYGHPIQIKENNK